METLVQRTKAETREGGEGGKYTSTLSRNLKGSPETNVLIIRTYRAEDRLFVFVFDEEKELKMLTDNKKLSNREGRRNLVEGTTK